MYDYIDVTNQAELNAAIAAGDYPHITDNGRYEIPSDIHRGHIIKISGSSTPSIETWGSSTPRIETRGSSDIVVTAHDYVNVLAAGSMTINAGPNVTVRALGSGPTVHGGALTQRVPLTTEPAAVRSTLAHIEANPQEWNQGTWAMETECGTRYCAAGHALLTVGARMDVGAATVEVASLPERLRSRFVHEHVAISAGARAVLGLDETTADRLFHGDNSIEDLRGLVEEICAGAEPQPMAVPAAKPDADATQTSSK